MLAARSFAMPCDKVLKVLVGKECASADPDSNRSASLVDQIAKRGRADRQHFRRTLVIILEFRFRVHARIMGGRMFARPRGNLAAI